MELAPDLVDDQSEHTNEPLPPLSLILPDIKSIPRFPSGGRHNGELQPRIGQLLAAEVDNHKPKRHSKRQNSFKQDSYSRKILRRKLLPRKRLLLMPEASETLRFKHDTRELAAPIRAKKREIQLYFLLQMTEVMKLYIIVDLKKNVLALLLQNWGMMKHKGIRAKRLSRKES